jgi:hypothetical protein
MKHDLWHEKLAWKVLQIADITSSILIEGLSGSKSGYDLCGYVEEVSQVK